jgi:DHA1 family inner membrane transport protein
VLLAMLISVLASASLFSVFTYITPLLRVATGFSPGAVTWVLLLFGVGLTLGNFLGGWLADWRLMPSVTGLAAVLALVLALLAVAVQAEVPAVAVIGLWGIVAFALVSPLQLRVVREAAGAPNLASTVNQGAFNLGNAAGAWMGGLALGWGLPYAQLPWLGAGLAVLVFGFSLLSWRIDAREPALLQQPAAGE